MQFLSQVVFTCIREKDYLPLQGLLTCIALYTDT